MDRLPVVHKTKLTKEQTYFINAPELSQMLSGSRQYHNVELQFSDDPSLFKSNYDRFVKKEGKLVIASVRYTPQNENQAQGGMTRSYRVTIYAILKTIRDDLIAQFEEEHYQILQEWIEEQRDSNWFQKPHALQFLIDLDTEEIEVAHDIDFDSYKRHSKKQRHRVDGRKHQ